MSTAESPVIRPVILCGGSGTRLWPLSTPELPKQFLPLVGEKSLLRQTIERLGEPDFTPAIIVSGAEQANLISHELRRTDAGVEIVLLEPIARNTAPAAGLAAAWVEAQGRDDLLLLMPSDHVIGDLVAFRTAIERAVPYADDGAIVTFGATPSEPNGQYGYIEAEMPELSAGVHRIAEFHEKPTASLAQQYVASGKFYWNCGIFLARASTLTREMERFLPASMLNIRAAVAHSDEDAKFVRPAFAHFAQAENISIDNGIMEKTDRGVVVPVRMKWSDVGAWDAVWKLSEKDETGNVIRGDVTVIDTRNSLLRTDGTTKIAAIGLDDFVVIAVNGAILIAPVARVSEVKALLGSMNGLERLTPFDKPGTGELQSRNSP